MAHRTYTPCAETVVWLDRASYPRWIHLPLTGGAIALIASGAYFEPIAAVPVALVTAFVASMLVLRGYLMPVAVALEERALVVVRERMYTRHPKVIRVALDDIVCVSRQWHSGRDLGLLVHTRSARRIPLDLAMAAYCIQLNRSGIELNDHDSMVDALCLVLHARGITIGRPAGLLARLRARVSGERARIREEPHSPPAEPFIEPGWLALFRTSAVLVLPLACLLTFGIPQLGATTPSSDTPYAVKQYRGQAPVYVSEVLGVVHNAALPIAVVWFLAAAVAGTRLRRAHHRRLS